MNQTDHRIAAQDKHDNDGILSWHDHAFEDAQRITFNNQHTQLGVVRMMIWNSQESQTEEKNKVQRLRGFNAT